TEHIAKALAKEYPEGNNLPATFTDFRHILDDKNIDAVVITTPNYWHSLMTIMACQAGKDVYVEKPISHNIFEGRIAVNAARKYKRIVQAGTQNRSDIGLIPLMDYVHAGNLGEIEYVHTLCYRQRNSIGKTYGPQPIPATVDYDMWTGPAPLHPLRRKNLHYDWHWVWETGNGDLGNQGVHEADLALWALQKKELPERVVSFGGRFGYDDDGNTANTQVAVLDYKPAPVICEVRNLPRIKGVRGMDVTRGIRVGVIIQCKDGYFAGGRGGGWVYDNAGTKVKHFPGDAGKTHQRNFIEGVRSRKISDLKADIEACHLSSSLSHMAEISYRLGNHGTVEEASETIAEYPAAVKAWESVQGNLAVNEVDLVKTPVCIGPWLQMDPATERFKQNEEYGPGRWANELVKPQYRKPFVVTETV
ncbi:MAG: Gfo/Idh/MocA family oxidoreductase, partial [Planctomycetes bacterium]|nr:Gfo/Idh/MocA family oxidoreductase [Planctomycetota bacterium]